LQYPVLHDVSEHPLAIVSFPLESFSIVFFKIKVFNHNKSMKNKWQNLTVQATLFGFVQSFRSPSSDVVLAIFE